MNILAFLSFSIPFFILAFITVALILKNNIEYANRIKMVLFPLLFFCVFCFSLVYKKFDFTLFIIGFALISSTEGLYFFIDWKTVQRFIFGFVTFIISYLFYMGFFVVNFLIYAIPPFLILMMIAICLFLTVLLWLIFKKPCGAQGIIFSLHALVSIGFFLFLITLIIHFKLVDQIPPAGLIISTISMFLFMISDFFFVSGIFLGGRKYKRNISLFSFIVAHYLMVFGIYTL